ncbi:hypothetical protein M408DRAFT_28960 [Serendipita vermifera MAFF 305830]|uniref:Nephrocystin 3-like N-terminal domain-containing protein n=1 Tax=Serendipita vermifera MAFF 305830 TaxID=933852 RepID=A0A0C3ABZ6_SERVB|nr:hypothetical protein M408DRAFT_28960 [Serendipita vermifera MAFF 305830]
MGNCLSKDQAEGAEEVLTATAKVVLSHVPDSGAKGEAVPPPRESKTILSGRPDMDFKQEGYDSDKAIAAINMGIEVIDLFQKVAKVTEMVLPSPLGDVLEKVTSVLGVLKKMVENRQAWQGLLATIDDHQKTFNDQLVRLKVDDMVPDPESPLLAPVMQYSETLEKFAAKIMVEGGLVNKNAPETSNWEKIKKFATRALNAESEQGSMEGYTNQLAEAMNQFRFTLEIFVSFRVESIKVGVDALATDLRAVGEDVKDVKEMVARNSEPKDTINAIPVTAFGLQHKTCLEGTRVGILEEIRAWAAAKETTTPIYCIGDVAGTGKSTISRTMYDEWLNKDQNPLGFFFSQAGASVQTATDFCFSMGEQIRALPGSDQEEYWKKLESTFTILRSQGVPRQWAKLVMEPLSKLPASETHVLLIDALDECTIATREPLLECLLNAISAGSLPNIRVFITTRNEPDILKFIQNQTIRTSASAKADVAFYVNHRLDEANLFVSDSPSQDAGGETKPLQDILHEFTSLDVLYHQTLARADTAPKYTREPLKNILGIVAVAQEPLPITALAALLPASDKPAADSLKQVQTLVGKLGSILGSGGVDEPVYILHATFKEFLLRQTWITTTGYKVANEYAVSQALSNRSLARGCLSLLLKELKENANEQPSAALRYASLVWVSHLILDLHIQDLRASMRKFFEEKLLNWIELSSNNDKLPECLLSIGQLRSSLERMRSLKAQNIADEDIQWCTDTLTFLRLNQALLISSPSNVYSSAIVFTTSDNLVRKHHEPRLRNALPSVVLRNPDSDSKSVVLPGSSGTVTQVCYSLEGNLLASASMEYEEGDIIVWDVETGAQVAFYSVAGYNMTCYGITFLPGNKTVFSLWSGITNASPYDSMLHRLDVDSSDLISPPQSLLLGNEISLNCIAWAPKGTHIVCGSTCGLVGAFSLDTGSLVGTVQQAHNSQINNLAFSADGLSVVSSSSDNSIKVWSMTSTGLSGPSYTWTSEGVNIYGASFSPANPSLLAVAVGETTLQIRNIKTGELDLEVGETPVQERTIYSPDGEYITTLGWSQQWISLIKRENGKAVKLRLDTGHNIGIRALAFSPDKKHIVSGSDDKTLRIHNLSDTGPAKAVGGHQTQIGNMAFTPDGKRMVSSEWNGNLCTWNLETGQLLEGPMETEANTQSVLAYSSDGSTVAIASGSHDIQLWNLKTKAKHPVELNLGYPTAGDSQIHAIALSHDDSTLAIIARAYFEDCEKVLLCVKRLHEPEATAITIEPDIQPIPDTFNLGYHPSGEYLCCVDQAWELASNPPTKLTGDKLATVLKETFPISLEYHNDYQSPPSITLGSPVRHTLDVPKDLLVGAYGCFENFGALGGQDGRLTVLDFSRLLSPEETALLSRIRDIRRATAAKAEPSKIHALFSS